MDRDRPLRILAFEAFDAGSHRAVRESIMNYSRHDWRWITRPGRAWKWRMRTGAIELIDQARDRGALDDSYDLIFATSMLNLPDLRALLPESMRATPAVLYMHENQAAYPARPEAQQTIAERDAHFALTNLTSLLTADLVIWNSAWNQRSFVEEIEALLARAPDGTLEDVGKRIRAKSEIIWPPVDPPPPEVSAGEGEFDSTIETQAGGSAASGSVLHNTDIGGYPDRPVRVVWPHRWEHDKGPEALLRLARRYSEKHNLRWTILGEEFSREHPALTEFRRRFADHIDHIGFARSRAEYWRHLIRCDWVLSTAKHEFFGIAVVEAMLAGCLPWLPNRLSYPELLPPVARGLNPIHPPTDVRAVREAIRAHLEPALASNAVARLDGAVINPGPRSCHRTH